MNISRELLTKEDAYKVANLDSTLSTSSNYARDNSLTYYVAINTWLLQIEDHDSWARLAVAEEIQHHGLVSAIKDCDQTAFELVKGLDITSTSVGRLLATMPIRPREYFGLNSEKNIYRDTLATRLQLLRYLKRFSPVGNDIIQKDSLNKFIQNENVVKMKQRREYPTWLIDTMKELIEGVIDWDSIILEFESDPLKINIPTGVTYEGYATMRDKVNAIYSMHPELAYSPFGLPYVFPYYREETDTDACRVTAVPKSYKASRIIAMEPVFRQSRSNVLAKIIERYLPPFIDIKDQERNQRLAWEGSKYGHLATLDASNASDLISKTLFRSVFPSRIVTIVDPLFSHYTEINGKRRCMQMMSTAGHSLTFIFETIVYWAIAAAACRYVSLFGTSQACRCSAYGDDVIISTSAAQTAIEFYTMLGLKINEDKSFISGSYRESCGEEYLDGICLSTIYYPRFPVVGSITSKSINFGVRMYRDSYRGKTDDSTTMLIDLQKRLFGISYPASQFVWELVKKARPRITSSVNGSICNDLWAAVDLGIHNTPRTIKHDQVSPDVMRALSTRKHSYVSIQYTLSPIDKLRYENERNFELFKYQNFLRTGPSYSDPLLELLGVSDSPMTVEQYAGYGRLVWRYQF